MSVKRPAYSVFRRALHAALAVLCLSFYAGLPSGPAMAQCIPCKGCCGDQQACGNNCACTSEKQTNITIEYITDEFLLHRQWLMTIVWETHMLPAMMLMTESLTATAMQQITMIGSVLDAKHQLESQALFQSLHADAHKDYHVSEGVCQFGTQTKSLAAANRNAEFSQIVLANRMLQRGLLSGDTISSGPGSDRDSRLDQYIKVYCNPQDNAKGLTNMCGAGGTDKTRYNKDVDFTTTVDKPHTLKLDFSPEGDADHKERGVSPDEEDLFALSANLYGHEVPPKLQEDKLAKPNGDLMTGAYGIMDLRSLNAKRAVAQNSFAAIAAMKAQGGTEVKPYMEALLKEIGVPDDDIKLMLGDRPSYYAQMDVLTKKIYQDPVFYADLYDKPANVMRKNVAMRAINNIQKRDIYRSMLRTEAIMSVWLETELLDIQEPIANEFRKDFYGAVMPIPGGSGQ